MFIKKLEVAFGVAALGLLTTTAVHAQKYEVGTSGYVALVRHGGLTDADKVALTVTDTSTATKAEVKSEGGLINTTETGYGAIAQAGAFGYAAAEAGAVHAAVRTIAATPGKALEYTTIGPPLWLQPFQSLCQCLRRGCPN